MIAKGRKERRKEGNWLENMERLKKGDGIVRHPLIFHTERSRHINISLIWCTQGLVLKVFPTLLKCKSDWCSFTCKSYSLQTNHLSVEMKRSPISGVSNWSPLSSTTSKKKSNVERVRMRLICHPCKIWMGPRMACSRGGPPSLPLELISLCVSLILFLVKTFLVTFVIKILEDSSLISPEDLKN